MNITARTVAVRVLQLYKMIVSPWLPPACRFTPTCSEYAAEAFQEYGIARGLVRSIARLLRCHPLHPGGFDPLT